MPSGWSWKALGTLVAILGSIYILVPSFFTIRTQTTGVQAEKSGWDDFFPDQKINLGLDLRGGMYLELSVDLKGSLENRVDVLGSEMERLANREKFPGIKIARKPSTTGLIVELPPEKRQEFVEFVRTNFGDVFQLADEAPGEALPPNSFELSMLESYATYLQDLTLKQAEEAVRNRVDRYGVAEASIQRQGENRLIVELPGIQDPDRVVNIIRKTGQLEFKLVDSSVDAGSVEALVSQTRAANTSIPEGYSKESVDQINAALVGKIPADSEIAFELIRDPVSKQVVSGRAYLLKKKAEVTGDMLQNAQVNVSENKPHVSIAFNKVGTNIFAELTRANVQKPLAILLDGVVSMAPIINEPILNGEGQISLGFGSYQSLIKEADDLALLLREGALPAALTVQTKTVIGPSLGADSIRAGLVSIIIAALVIFIFMMAYYRWGGVLATLALILNIIFLFAILALFQASLTLPGIAGIVLTMGMAVDANVIIFERMREEKRAGKTPRAVVESGYGNAMSAIIDSNITTMISGIVLFQFGTGPIKGFATTLMIGILTTLFTAIIVTRLGYDYFIFKRKIKKISI